MDTGAEPVFLFEPHWVSRLRLRLNVFFLPQARGNFAALYAGKRHVGAGGGHDVSSFLAFFLFSVPLKPSIVVFHLNRAVWFIKSCINHFPCGEAATEVSSQFS